MLDDTRARELAYLALSQLPGWPATLELAMEQAMPASLIRMTAMGLRTQAWNVGVNAKGQLRHPAPMTGRTQPRTTRHVVYGLPLPSLPPLLDHKMRAAGEREED